jgi:hypothetical protein
VVQPLSGALILKNNFLCGGNLPKHIPHSPLSIVRMITHKRDPAQKILNTAKEKTSTITVCIVITTNCVTTCENRISGGVTPVNKNY